MKPGDLGVRVAAAHAARPPLGKMHDRGVVTRHFDVEPPNLPIPLPQPQTKFRLFAGDQLRSIAADGVERVRSNQRVAAAGVGLANRRVPLEVAKRVINRGCRILFTPPPTDDRDLRASGEKGARLGEPMALQDAVPVDKLDKPNRGIAGFQRLIAGVARPRGGEWKAEVEVHH